MTERLHRGVRAAKRTVGPPIRSAWRRVRPHLPQSVASRIGSAGRQLARTIA